MKKFRNTDNLDSMLECISLYFDCRLSDSEEDQLRSDVFTTRLHHPAIDEARAVMGFRRRRRVPNHLLTYRRFGAVAAVAAIFIGVVIAVSFWSRDNSGYLPEDEPVCMAYCNGRIITDQATVERIVAEGLQDFNQDVEAATSDFREDISDDALEIEAFESIFDTENQ